MINGIFLRRELSAEEERLHQRTRITEDVESTQAVRMADIEARQRDVQGAEQRIHRVQLDQERQATELTERMRQLNEWEQRVNMVNYE
ncbi:unnamed protein product [Protopolystoma xenopodis]|uniref:Uncharacterized protein n=1 Tax=Protopolystoma xenopodis TaxID=117903 RepID=A0A3S5A4S0_9PLAT|nr:unnamed protein product [Protopolystoma xenopodis]